MNDWIGYRTRRAFYIIVGLSAPFAAMEYYHQRWDVIDAGNGYALGTTVACFAIMLACGMAAFGATLRGDD